MIASLGSIGLGMVWGWLIGKFDGQITRPYVMGLSLTGATAVVTAEVLWLAGLQGVVCFLLAMLTGLFLLTEGRKDLLKRQTPSLTTTKKETLNVSNTSTYN